MFLISTSPGFYAVNSTIDQKCENKVIIYLWITCWYLILVGGNSLVWPSRILLDNSKPHQTMHS